MMQRIILVNRRREIFQVKRLYWQPLYVLLAANSRHGNVETTFEFSRKALNDSQMRSPEESRRGSENSP